MLALKKHLTSCLMMGTKINNNCVAFFDSGIGGLPYLRRAKELLPDEQFVYVADRRNFPYGEKSASEITKAVLDGIESIINKENPKAVVIACNTASVVALKELRKKYSIPFVGVVPAVKPAAAISKTKRLGLIATLKTVEDDYLNDLIEKFAGNCKVIRLPAGDVRDFVEYELFKVTKKEKLEFLSDTLSSLKSYDIDVVVLACTHFLLLEDEFKEVLGMNISVIDSREGVVKQLRRMLDKMKIRSNSNSKYNKFYITGDNQPEDRYKKIAEKYNLKFSGII